MNRLQELLNFLAANPGLAQSERDAVFIEALGIIDAMMQGSPEAQAWYERFAEYFEEDEEDAEEDDYSDEEPEVLDKEEDDPTDPSEDPEVPVPQLPSHQIDVPEEPERVEVITQVWDAATSSWKLENLGILELVPTGCEEPEALSPYENTVSFRSPLPRDKEREANLFKMYQDAGWASRAWIRQQLDEDLSNGDQLDKEIADDIPIVLALAGKPDVSAGVAQSDTSGKGDNNGAPLPPGPGPGRGNKFAPGDNAAG